MLSDFPIGKGDQMVRIRVDADEIIHLDIQASFFFHFSYDCVRDTLPNFHRWCALLREAITCSGYTADVTRYMERLLNDTGCWRAQRSETCIDIGAASPFNQRIYRDLAMLLPLLEPFLTSAHRLDREQMSDLSRDVIIDLYDESFRGEWVLVTVACEKAGGLNRETCRL